MKIRLLVTGATAELSAIRIEHLKEHTSKVGARISVLTQPGPRMPDPFDYEPHPLWALMFWSMHLTGVNITPRNVQERLDYGPAFIDRMTARYHKAKYCEITSSMKARRGGPEQGIWRLTPNGLANAQGWVTNILNGYLIALEVSEPTPLNLRDTLGNPSGVVAATSTIKSNPGPRGTLPPALMQAWTREQSGQHLTSANLIEALDVEGKQANKLLDQLAKSGWITLAHRGAKNRGYYQLTEQGRLLAYDYIRTLLL